MLTLALALSCLLSLLLSLSLSRPALSRSNRSLVLSLSFESLAVQLTAVMVPILYQIQQPEVDLKTPEEVGNYTFRANKFFRDQLLFSNEQLLTNLSSAFVGRYYAPGELIAARGTIPSMLIVENGTARIIPNTEEDRFQFKDNFQHGDAFGTAGETRRGDMAGRHGGGTAGRHGSGWVAWSLTGPPPSI